MQADKMEIQKRMRSYSGLGIAYFEVEGLIFEMRGFMARLAVHGFRNMRPKKTLYHGGIRFLIRSSLAPKEKKIQTDFHE